MPEYERLLDAIQPVLEKPLSELPKKMRKRIESSFECDWNDLTSRQRTIAAKYSDMVEAGEERRYWAEYFQQDEHGKLRDEIKELESTPADNVAQLKEKKTDLIEKRKRKEQIEIEYKELIQIISGAKPIRRESKATTKVKSVSRSQAQETAILREIENLGHTPTNMPKRVNGKPWIKADVNKLLVGSPELLTENMFKKSWKRLRKSGQLAEQ